MSCACPASAQRPLGDALPNELLVIAIDFAATGANTPLTQPSKLHWSIVAMAFALSPTQIAALPLAGASALPQLTKAMPLIVICVATTTPALRATPRG